MVSFLFKAFYYNPKIKNRIIKHITPIPNLKASLSNKRLSRLSIYFHRVTNINTYCRDKFRCILYILYIVCLIVILA